ncbi:Metallo-dependent phosphatase-like protein [Phascolomyces articulosus]|uniref:Metallo-dependent phosphatase-like protein n=1 Tax=Phascolomyces articulosus TaxID=60185 RepID=A0AAD5JUB0_9FUNG|nr:Metallo-dependent phosphatase-like protein [Phascolomyces articulosus]
MNERGKTTRPLVASADFTKCNSASVQRMHHYAWQGCLRLGTSPSLQHKQPQKDLDDDQKYRYFIQITDFHVDLNYKQGTSVKTACHRSPNMNKLQEISNNDLQQEPFFATKRKHHPAGRLGAPFEKCDTPLELAQQTLDWVARNWKDKVDFVIWTGDNSRHDWDRKESRRRNHILKLNKLVTDMMAETFDNDIPIIPCLGNNDVYPHNRIVDHDDILPFFANLWEDYIPPSERNHFLQGGYFVKDIGKNLRIISLNTMYFIKKNKSVNSCRKNGPARDHMQWFDEALKQAKIDKKRVFIMGHVPPSPRDYRGTCFRQYLDITSNHNHVIAGHFFGHLNMDHFLLYDSQQYSINKKSSKLATATSTRRRKPLSTLSDFGEDDDEFHVSRNIERYVDWLRDMYESIEVPKDTQKTPPDQEDDSNLVAIHVSPSILPVYYPTVRIYRYTDSLQGPTLLGYNQYYANITRWEQDHLPGEPLEYELEYTTENDYDLQDLSASSLFKFAKYMIEGESDTMWNSYTRNMFIRTQNETFPIDDDDDDDDGDDDDDDDGY